MKTEITLTKIPRVAEYVKIRQYVVDATMRSGGKPERLSSIRELAEKFGVSFATIQKALRQLIDDDLLIARPGVGIFTNPEPNAERRQHNIIGLLAGSGRLLYYDNYLWNLCSHTGAEISDRFYYLHLVNLLGSDRSIGGYLKPLEMNGLIWICPRISNFDWKNQVPEIKFPLVTVNAHMPGVPSVMLDADDEGYRVGRRLISEGRRTPIMVCGGEQPEATAAGFRRAFAEAGIALNERLLLRSNLQLREMLELGVRFDALYCYGGMLRGAVELIEEFQLDLRNDCLLVGDYYCWNRPMPGIAVFTDPVKVATAAWRLLERRMKDPRSEAPPPVTVRCELVTPPAC